MPTSAAYALEPERMDAATFYTRRAEFDHCELVDGEVVPMSPTGFRHGGVEIRIGRYLDEAVEARGRGEVAGGEVGYQLDAEHVRAADVCVHLDDAPVLEQGWMTAMPDLVVEVVSPRDTWAAVERKVAEWLGAGVQEVWVADPTHSTVTVRRPDQLRVFERDDTLTTPLLPELELPLARVFRSSAPEDRP